MSARRNIAVIAGAALLGVVLVWAVIALATPAPASAPPAVPAPGRNWLRTPTNIAHALGGLTVNTSKGRYVYTQTNTREAFEQNYAKGYRLFEVDLIMTRDGHLVARHDWSKARFKSLGQRFPRRVPSHKEFLATKVLGKYTPLDIEGVVEIMRTHPDVYIITDTKYSGAPNVRRQFRALVNAMGADKATLSQRVIVQIYEEAMFKRVRAVYRFPNVIYTLYRLPLKTSVSVRAARFARTHGIRVVTIDLFRYSPKVVRLIRAQGVAVAVNTVNSSASAKKINSAGARFIYSDVLAGRPPGAKVSYTSSAAPRLAPDAIPVKLGDD